MNLAAILTFRGRNDRDTFVFLCEILTQERSLKVFFCSTMDEIDKIIRGRRCEDCNSSCVTAREELPVYVMADSLRLINIILTIQ